MIFSIHFAQAVFHPPIVSFFSQKLIGIDCSLKNWNHHSTSVYPVSTTCWCWIMTVMPFPYLTTVRCSNLVLLVLNRKTLQQGRLVMKPDAQMFGSSTVPYVPGLC